MPKLDLNLGHIGHDGAMKQRMVNMYSEATPQMADKSVRFSRPGLVPEFAVGVGPIRCSFLWQGHRIIVSSTSVYFDNVLLSGPITGSDICRFAISDEEVVVVANGTAWYVTNTTVAPNSSPNLPENTVDVLLMAGRFLYLDGNSSTVWYSDVGDAQSIDGESFFEADENSSQTLKAGFVLVDDMAFFMDDVVEWWDAQDDADNPFIRSPGRKYNKGIAARATTVLLDNTVFWLGSDRIVYRASAVPTRVSNFDMEDIIRQVDAANLPNCSAVGITYGGHTIYLLNLPGLGTWALDISSGSWVEWKTWNKDRFQVTVADELLLGDVYSGQMFSLDYSAFNENSNPIERVVSAYLPVATGYLRNFNLYLKCTRGVGLVTGYGSNPVVEMRFTDTDDAGFTPWMQAPLGIQGDKSDSAKAIWFQLGSIRSPGRLFEFRCTDPVFFAPVSAMYNEKLP